MRIAAMAAAMMMAGCGGASAEEIGGSPNPPVVVCMPLGFDVQPVSQAQKLAAEMFAGIGVNIEWPHGRTPCPRENAIVVSLSYHTAENDHPDAWAYALPYEGAHIVVFWDRIQQKMPVGRAQILLAHVLVHEIAHILQGVSRHSDTGIMKARWSDGDIFQMMKKPLSFTPYDVIVIRRGMEIRPRSTRGTKK
jgi:hypothetical protein